MKAQHQAITYGPEYLTTPYSFRLRWVEHVSHGLRMVGFADELAPRRIRHTGWFTDERGDGEKVRGVVYALPAKGGARRFVAGYADPDGDDAAALDFTDVYDCPEDAAVDADTIAERCAEIEREWQEASAARCHHDELGGTIERELSLVRKLRDELRVAPLNGRVTVRDVVFDKVRACFEVIRQNRRTMEALEDEYGRHDGWKEGGW